MRLIRCGLIFSAVALVLGCDSQTETAQQTQKAAKSQADLLLINAAVYPMTGENQWAQAIAVHDGHIVAVGTNEDVQSGWSGPVRDLQGAMVLPGFHDAHVHPIAGGIQLGQCDLTDLPSADAIQQAVAGCVERSEPGGWVVGGGWNLGLFEDANPSKALLDAVSADRAVFLTGADGHSGWANSEALHRAGVERETPDPHNGIIERDAKGEPSGVLRESAQTLVERFVPQLSHAERKAGAVRGLARAHEFGITSLIEAAAGRAEMAIYRELEIEGALNMRVVASLTTADSVLGDRAVELSDVDSRELPDLVRPIAAKVFVDGVLEGETAALLEPYASGGTGRLEMEATALNELVAQLDAEGLQVHMHAIGDRAVRAALDAVAHAKEVNGVTDNRHHIAHLQLIDPADYPRFAELNVTANFQSLWAFPDAYITDVNLPAVGQARVDRMYPLHSLQAAGARIVGGSDWFVSSINPLLAIETAVTRQDPLGGIPGVLNAAERVSLHTMLQAYTTNGAWLMHQEKRVGQIVPGYVADLVVLDKNLFEIEPAMISDVRVLATYFNGELVYSSESP